MVVKYACDILRDAKENAQYAGRDFIQKEDIKFELITNMNE